MVMHEMICAVRVHGHNARVGLGESNAGMKAIWMAVATMSL